MSRLLGPLSETISKVSERASALAADQIAGAGTMAPAATPVTDLRKSRRFMVISKHEPSAWKDMSQGSCQLLGKSQCGAICLVLLCIIELARTVSANRSGKLHTQQHCCTKSLQPSDALFC